MSELSWYSSRHFDNSPKSAAQGKFYIASKAITLSQGGQSMTKIKTFTGILGACLFLTLVSSVRADVVRPNMDLEKLFYAQNHGLGALEVGSVATGYLYAGHF